MFQSCGSVRPVQNGRGVPHVASADPNRELRAHSTRITITFPRDLTAAIAKWRMLQPGRPKRATAIVELIAGGLAATTAIHKGEPESTTQDAPTETPAETETAT